MFNSKETSKRLITLLVAMYVIFVTVELQASEQKRQVLSMDFGWKFIHGDPENAHQIEFDDSDWRDIDLPHDWSIEGPYDRDAPTGGSGGYLPTGVGWYRKHFKLPETEPSRRIWVEFDGVYENSTVWINGQKLGSRPFGYISFYYDLTSHLRDGENVIAVRVDNSNQPNSRWYSGSGIYRRVRLVVMDTVHIGHWGVYATTPKVSEESAIVLVRTLVENEGSSPVNDGLLRTVLVDAKGQEVGKSESRIEIESGRSIELEQQIQIDSPNLWSFETHGLYTLRSEIYKNGMFVDDVSTNIGIRKIKYDSDRGFLLNGKRVKMNGVCLHHDGGCVGAAVPVRVWERRLEVLKEMGCNAIRTAHNPPAPEFLDLCDRMGFLVMDEAFDEWQIAKTKYSYHRYFDEWSERDLVDFIHRDRNHPSVVMWSVGNEVREQPREGGHEVLKRLVDITHREDPTRPVTQGCDNIAADGGSTTLEFLKLLDIIGYNYMDRWHERRELYCSQDKQDHPDWKFVGTESSPVRGPWGSYSLGRDPERIRANYVSGMIRAEQLWKFVSMHDYVIGDFMWTGIDYLGESRWPGKNSYSGVIDLCGFPKDNYYFYQSQWTDEPMLHIFPHWNWPGREGQFIPVLAYTNCDTVELYLNDKFIAEKRLEFPRQGTSGGWNRYENYRVNPTTADLHLSWDVPYEPGMLRAVGKRDGEIVCTKEIHTAGEPAAIRLSLDRDAIIADARDVAHVRVEIVDDRGVLVPVAENLIRFEITGQGRLIGVDNGNPTDHNSYKVPQRQTFNGKALVIIQSIRTPGKINLTASADGLKGSSVEIKVQPANIITLLP